MTKKPETNIRQRFNFDNFRNEDTGYLVSTTEIYKNYLQRYNLHEDLSNDFEFNKEKNEPYFRYFGAKLFEVSQNHKITNEQEVIDNLKLEEKSNHICIVCWIMFDIINSSLKLKIRNAIESKRQIKVHEFEDFELVDKAIELLKQVCDKKFAKEFALYSNTIQMLQEIKLNYEYIKNNSEPGCIFTFFDEVGKKLTVRISDVIRRSTLFYSYPQKVRSKIIVTKSNVE